MISISLCIHRYIWMLPKPEACEAPTYERPLCSDTSHATGVSGLQVSLIVDRHVDHTDPSVS